MADSAMMRAAIPTVPRYGRLQPSGVSRAGVVIASVALTARYLSHVAAVRICRMLQIPQWPATGDCRDGRKVVCRRCVAYRTFESPCVPGIIPCESALPIRNNDVRDKHQDGD